MIDDALYVVPQAYPLWAVWYEKTTTEKENTWFLAYLACQTDDELRGYVRTNVGEPTLVVMWEYREGGMPEPVTAGRGIAWGKACVGRTKEEVFEAAYAEGNAHRAEAVALLEKRVPDETERRGLIRKERIEAFGLGSDPFEPAAEQ